MKNLIRSCYSVTTDGYPYFVLTYNEENDKEMNTASPKNVNNIQAVERCVSSTNLHKKSKWTTYEQTTSNDTTASPRDQKRKGDLDDTSFVDFVVNIDEDKLYV